METKMTIKDALKMMYQELKQVSVPAEFTFSIGIHVGKSLMILKDCIGAIEQEEQTQAEQQEDVDLGEVDLGEEEVDGDA